MSLPAYASGSDKRDGLSYQEQDLEYCHLSAKEKNVKGIWLVAVIIHTIVPEKPWYNFSWKWSRKMLSYCSLPHRIMFDNISCSHGEALKSKPSSSGQLKVAPILALNVDYPDGRWTTPLEFPRNWRRIWTFVGQIYIAVTLLAHPAINM